jgi:hypothetical protein
VMTIDEQIDIRAMAEGMRRIERKVDDVQRKVDDQAVRTDRLEKFADRAEGALTLARFTLSLLGIGGIALVVAALAQGRV